MGIVGPRIDVALQVATRTQDAVGGMVDSWATTETMSVVFTPMSGNETKRYEKDTVKKLYTMFANPLKDDGTARVISENNRVLYNGDTYNILSVLNPFERNIFLKVDLEKVE